jgi:hypothetical protein
MFSVCSISSGGVVVLLDVVVQRFVAMGCCCVLKMARG